jgi:hypothetical protein
MLYRAHWSGAIFLLLLATPLAAAGLFALVVTFGRETGLTLACLTFAAFFLIAVFTGFNIVHRHYRINEFGLFLNDSFGARRDGFLWHDVEKWLVWPENGSTLGADWRMLFPEEKKWPRPALEYRGILFRLRGRDSHFFIAEWEVRVPSFDRFLDDVREALAEREVKTGATESPSPNLVGSDVPSDAIQVPLGTAIEAASRR